MPELEYCLKEFRKLFPNLPVTSVFDYDKNRYLFVCTKPNGRHQFGANFLVSKDGKNADDYMPILDAENYNRAIDKGPIYKS